MPYPFSSVVRSPSGGYIYPDSSSCIYCGEQQGLTTEHIIPKGLYGDLIFPASSCDACRNITSGLESFVLQRVLGFHRRRFGYPSQTKKKRRNPIRGSIYRHEQDGSETEIELDGGDLPLWSFTLPVYGHPMLVGLGTEKEQCSGDKIHAVVSGMDAAMALAIPSGTRPVSLPPMVYDAGKFMRFIAKVAHSYATAALGRDSFNPLLSGLIREGHDIPRVWIGGEPEIPPEESNVYSITLGIVERYDQEKFLAARIRILDYLGTPVYTAIVGSNFEGNLSSINHCSYAKPIKATVIGRDGMPIFSTEG